MSVGFLLADTTAIHKVLATDSQTNKNEHAGEIICANIDELQIEKLKIVKICISAIVKGISV